MQKKTVKELKDYMDSLSKNDLNTEKNLADFDKRLQTKTTIPTKTNTYTLSKLKRFLNTLSKDQLKQPVQISMGEEPTRKLEGHFIVLHDYYVDVDDPENVGTLRDHKLNADESEPFSIDQYKLCTPKGTVIFFIKED